MAENEFNPLDYPAAWTLPPVFSGQSAWMEHIPFAYVLMQMLRPAVFVELGTWFGDSYFAFCQAVAQFNLSTRCHAVDHWLGDQHAGQLDSEAVYRNLKEHHDPRFGAFSELIRSSFDDASTRFNNGSIDLLHIDGLHTYEAVKHDYETWLSKLSSRAVVLFHDTNERAAEFGVWKLWSEVCAGRPHFEFLHEHGLGVLAVGPEVPTGLLSFLNQANNNPDRFRGYFSTLGSRITYSIAQQIFIHQTIALRNLAIDWAGATGHPQSNPVLFTPSSVTSQPSGHSHVVLHDLYALKNQAVELYKTSISSPTNQLKAT